MDLCLYKNFAKIKRNKERSFPGGYSIVEVLISLLIMTIIFGLGFTNYRAFQQRKQLDNIADMVKTDLSLTRQSALAGKKPVGSVCDSSSKILTGYYFVDTSDPATVPPTYSYSVVVYCRDSTGPFSYTLKTVNITSLVTNFSIIPSPIIFYPIGRGTNISAGSSVPITITKGTTTKTINVSAGGEFN